MAVVFDEGPKGACRGLCKTYPGPDVYTEGCRTKWGPIFYRGRVDGSARLLVIGQDTAQHEAFARRILMGEAGRRVQGFLAKLGFTKSYVMINAFVYGIFNQKIAGAHVLDAGIVAYRNKWFDAILASGKIQAVVAFGTFADMAWQKYRKTASGKKFKAAYQHVLHPTSEGKGKPVITMAKMLANWNNGIQSLRPQITKPDVTKAFVPYGTNFTAAELPGIPSFDLPAGIPTWMASTFGWAVMAATPGDQRANITITVPGS
jgi:uracil-DNA glycosylase